MRLTIFSRVMLAQSTLILLILIVSLYALAKLHFVSQLSTDALTLDATCINEEKRLLKAFLAEMRNAEKYLLIRDGAFYEGYTKNKDDFADALSKVTAIINTDREKELVTEIAMLHTLYNEEVNQVISGGGASEQTKSRMSEGIVEKANEMIRLRDQATSAKTTLVRDHASSAAEVLFWLTLFGMAGALLLAYLHARGISHPLKGLAQGMRHVGRGEFTRTIHINGPREVQELALAFNLMAEELEHLDRLKADFTAHVSHELRTPLTAIREGTALLLEEIPGPLTEGQREILDVVRNHSHRLYQSITSILDLSKMEAEMMDYDFTACDLNDLIDKSIQAVNLIARKREIELRTSIDDQIPMLMVDERRIQQVLDNLLSNALKFSPEKGEVYVDAFLSGNHGSARTVEIRVSDEGPGIPREELQNIFEHFYQSSKSKAKGQQGTGLGLAIARHIVEAHKGRIWAESETGSGSTFHFTLPVDFGAVNDFNTSGQTYPK
jgi:two-component system, NtrC family, sensor histidine kinase GlrK